MTAPPSLIIVSGPSGVGKSTLIRHVLQQSDIPLRLSVSATTRNSRPGEQDGVAYYFWSKEHFRAEVSAGHFLEWAEVVGNLYGTPWSELEKARQQGCVAVLDVDTQGAAQIRARLGSCVSVFLFAPSMEEYERRLRSRGTENEEVIARRMANARRELDRSNEYTYRIENNDLDTAVREVCEIIRRHFALRHDTGGMECSTS
jgi:guanylate kinase